MTQSVIWKGSNFPILLDTIDWLKADFMNTSYGHTVYFGDGTIYPPGRYTVIGGGGWTAWWRNVCGGVLYVTHADDHTDRNWNIPPVYSNCYWIPAGLTIYYNGVEGEGTLSAVVADSRFDYEHSVYKWDFISTNASTISTWLSDYPSSDNRGAARLMIHDSSLHGVGIPLNEPTG
jgi:hypothetical protein